jgi:hypothetical protein
VRAVAIATEACETLVLREAGSAVIQVSGALPLEGLRIMHRILNIISMRADSVESGHVAAWSRNPFWTVSIAFLDLTSLCVVPAHQDVMIVNY